VPATADPPFDPPFRDIPVPGRSPAHLVAASATLRVAARQIRTACPPGPPPFWAVMADLFDQAAGFNPASTWQWRQFNAVLDLARPWASGWPLPEPPAGRA